MDELETALTSTKKNKSPGLDGILPEFLLNLGPAAKRYLISLYSHIIKTGHLPKQFKETKIIALKKPGKYGSIPTHFRPVSLLSCSFKLFERIIHNRIQPLINKVLPIEQAGFREGRSCCEQVLTLTSFIEAAYQKFMKTGAVLIDLSSVYDTVWREGLLLNLSRVVRCRKTLNLINSMLTNRRMIVHLNGSVSR